jgi:hypothetical protein
LSGGGGDGKEVCFSMSLRDFGVNIHHHVVHYELRLQKGRLVVLFEEDRKR